MATTTVQAAGLWSNSSLCLNVHWINSKGIFNGHNPFKFSTPLLLFQLSLATLSAIITTVLLKPLGIPPMVTQIIGGIILGPTVLGRIPKYMLTIFPFRSFVMIDTYATFGTIFQVFLVGVQTDPVMLANIGRKSIIIGISTVVLPLILSMICTLILVTFVKLDDISIARSLLVVGATESMTAFPVIATYLSELNILNTEFSRIAFSSSMVSGVLCFSLVTTVMLLQLANNKIEAMVAMSVSTAFVVGIIFFLLRPIIRWIIRQIPEGHTVKEAYLCAVFMMAMVLAWLCRFAHIHMLFGPFVFGVSIPSGPPLGLALVDRLDYFNTWMIMPIFYTEHGMMMNLFGVKLKTALLVECVVLASCAGKFLGAFLPAIYFRMPYKDAILLGITMTAQGFLELSLFKMLREQELIDYDSFKVMCGSMIFLPLFLTPLMRYLYKSTLKYKLHNIRTIQHCEPNSELRVFACLHDQENVPPMIHLLKASNPTKYSPISVCIVHFVELVGRATPLIMSHKTKRKHNATIDASQRLFSVFKRYEENNKGCIFLHPYTVIAPFASMDIDACMLSLQKRSALIVLPYHKCPTTGTITSGIKTMNVNVLEKAPCSVAILIDRGLLGGFKFVLANWLSYHVAVIFLGGADDREALAYGMRMAEHPTIEVTVIRFLSSFNSNVDNMDNLHDNEMVSDFKIRTAYNNRVTFKEEEVMNGLGVINVLESIGDKYQLIIIGRHHDEKSPLILGLTEWEKSSEIGTIGDIFMASEYGGKATILVMQQQKRVNAPLPVISKDRDNTNSQNFDPFAEDEVPFRQDGR